MAILQSDLSFGAIMVSDCSLAGHIETGKTVEIDGESFKEVLWELQSNTKKVLIRTSKEEDFIKFAKGHLQDTRQKWNKICKVRLHAGGRKLQIWNHRWTMWTALRILSECMMHTNWNYLFISRMGDVSVKVPEHPATSKSGSFLFLERFQGLLSAGLLFFVNEVEDFKK